MLRFVVIALMWNHCLHRAGDADCEAVACKVENIAPIGGLYRATRYNILTIPHRDGQMRATSSGKQATESTTARTILEPEKHRSVCQCVRSVCRLRIFQKHEALGTCHIFDLSSSVRQLRQRSQSRWRVHLRGKHGSMVLAIETLNHLKVFLT